MSNGVREPRNAMRDSRKAHARRERERLAWIFGATPSPLAEGENVMRIHHRATESYSRTQSFTCSSELLRAFESRAYELGCTFDWLLEEAMQRLLAEAREARTQPPPASTHQRTPRTTSQPLPLPPDAMPSTVPPPPTRQQLRALTPPPRAGTR